MNLQIPALLPELLLMGAIVFGPLAFGAVESWSQAILAALIYAATFACALRGRPSLRGPVHRTILPAVLVLLLIGLVQMFNPRAISFPSTCVPITVSTAKTKQALMKWMTYAALLWCTPQVFFDLAALRRLARTIFGLGFFIAVIGIIQSMQNRLMIYGFRSVPYGYEPFGPYYNRDHAASLLIMSAFCGIGVCLDNHNRHHGQKEGSDAFNYSARQLLILFMFGIIFGGVLYTLSRGALTAFLVSGAILVAATSRSNRYRRVLLMLGGAAGIFLIASSPIATRLTSEYIRSSAAFRLSLYLAGINLFRDFPVFGIGLGAFQQAYIPYQARDITGVVQHIHCDWLELLLEVGIVGFLAYLLGLVLLLRQSFSSMSHPSGRSTEGLFLGIGAALLAFMLHGLVDFSFQIPANAVIFFVLLAALGSLPRSIDYPDTWPRAPSMSAHPLCKKQRRTAD